MNHGGFDDCLLYINLTAWDDDACTNKHSFLCEFILLNQTCASNPCQNGGVCVPSAEEDRYTCTCPTGYYGELCEDASCLPMAAIFVPTLNNTMGFRDCADIKLQGGFSSGVHKIRVSENCTGAFSCCIDVYCDMTTLGGGWTVLQRRINGSVDFVQNWAEYEMGFGQLTGEHWLGLKWAHYITIGLPGGYDVLITLQEHDETCFLYELMSGFYLEHDGCNTFYKLQLTAEIDGNAHQNPSTSSNSFYSHRGNSFTTIDADHDTHTGNCASSYPGGWWFSSCHSSQMNGQWIPGCGPYAKGINFYSARAHYYGFAGSQIMFRPPNFVFNNPAENNWCTDLIYTPCPQDCVYHQWTNWTDCAETCGNTTEIRYRNRTFTPASPSSAMPCVDSCTGCSGILGLENCSLGPCPIECEWGEWSAGAECVWGAGDECVLEFTRRKTVAEEFGGVCSGDKKKAETCDECNPMTKPERIAAAVFQTIGCTWLLILTGTTFVFCAIFRIASVERMIHGLEEIMIFVAHICILFFRDVTRQTALCTFVSFLLQYTFTSCFVLFLLEALQMYVYVTNVYKQGNFFSVQINLLIGLGLPAVLLLLPAAIWHQLYIGKYTCWLNMSEPIIAGFTVAPMAICALGTIIIIEAAGQGEFKKMPGVNSEKRLMGLSLFLIMPVCAAHWFFGMWGIYAQHVAYFPIIFGLNIALGVLIFIFHGLIHTAVKKFCLKVKNRVRDCCCPPKKEEEPPTDAGETTPTEQKGDEGKEKEGVKDEKARRDKLARQQARRKQKKDWRL